MVPRLWCPAVQCPECSYPNDHDFSFCQRCGYRRLFQSQQSVNSKIQLDLPSINNRLQSIQALRASKPYEKQKSALQKELENFLFSLPLSKSLWDTLETRRKKNRLTLMYKLSHNLVDITTENHLIPNHEKRTRNSHAFKYRMPKVSKDVFKFSFFPRSITEWNLLPADLVNCKSLSNFKLNLGKLVNK